MRLGADIERRGRARRAASSDVVDLGSQQQVGVGVAVDEVPRSRRPAAPDHRSSSARPVRGSSSGTQPTTPATAVGCAAAVAASARCPPRRRPPGPARTRSTPTASMLGSDVGQVVALGRGWVRRAATGRSTRAGVPDVHVGVDRSGDAARGAVATSASLGRRRTRRRSGSSPCAGGRAWRSARPSGSPAAIASAIATCSGVGRRRLPGVVVEPVHVQVAAQPARATRAATGCRPELGDRVVELRVVDHVEPVDRGVVAVAAAAAARERPAALRPARGRALGGRGGRRRRLDRAAGSRSATCSSSRPISGATR